MEAYEGPFMGRWGRGEGIGPQGGTATVGPVDPWALSKLALHMRVPLGSLSGILWSLFIPCGLMEQFFLTLGWFQESIFAQ